MCYSSNASEADDDDCPETDASQDEHQSEIGAESSCPEEHDHVHMQQGEGGRADACSDIPGNAIVKKLQSRPQMGGWSPVRAVGCDEDSAFSKDKRSYKLPTVQVVK